MTRRPRPLWALPGALALLVLLASGAVAQTGARAAAEAAVRALLEATEAIMSGPPEDRSAELQRLFRRAFDASALTARAAPPAVWAAAAPADRQRLTAVLLCRMAVMTLREGGRGADLSWSVLGSRADVEAVVVAVRTLAADGGERTLLYDVVGAPGAARIIDVRSQEGRLSVRMGEAMLRDAGPPGADPAAWIAAVPCRY